MDGAIILAADASRIARANVHLMPDAVDPDHRDGHPAPDRRAGGPVHRRARCCRCRPPCRSSPSTATTSSTRSSPPGGCTTAPTRRWPPCSASGAGSTSPSATSRSSSWRTPCRSGTSSASSRPPRWSCGSPRRSTATWSSWARTAAWSACSRPSCPTGWPGRSTWWSATTAVMTRRRGRRLVRRSWTAVVDQLADLPSDELRDPSRVAGDPAAARRVPRRRVGGRAPRLPAAAPPAAVLRHDHRADRGPVRQPPADHAGVDRRARAGRRGRPDPGHTRSRTAWPVWPRPASSSATSSGRRPPAPSDRPRATVPRGPSGGHPAAGRMGCFPTQTGCRSPAPVPHRNARRNGVRHR